MVPETDYNLSKKKRKIARKYPLLKDKLVEHQLIEVNDRNKHRYYFWNCISLGKRDQRLKCLMIAVINLLPQIKLKGIRVFQLLSFDSCKVIKIMIHPRDKRAMVINIPPSIECTKETCQIALKKLLTSTQTNGITNSSVYSILK